MSLNGRSSRRARRGVALFIALAATTLLVAAAAMLTQSLVAASWQQRLAGDRLQVERLADAGLERAAAQLARDSAFAGESWRLDPQTTGLDLAAVVEIRIVQGDGRPRKIVVTATSGSEPPRLATAQRELELARE